ncbi:unnamed protein product [Schistosoma margrebowiei]|uniref:DUF4806 domain-containing protein n=1 Tax=Schistosoma margrebowiei TaxID=48269 RepID=A0AA84Z8R4_9TREM|nr:unnamed protein product [Schistosoma margrebowiei]
MSPAIHLSVKDELDKMVIEMMKGGYISIKKADQILDIFAPMEFPVVNISTGTFSPIASSSKADVSSPLPRTSTEVDKPLCDDTNKMLRTLLKSVSELSTKIDKILFLCERLAMSVIDRRTEEMDSDTIHFPLRTHEELRSLEAALENQKYRDHFVARLCNLMCENTRKSAKACLQYLLSPELANTYTLHGTRSKFGISKYKFYSTVQSKSTLLY